MQNDVSRCDTLAPSASEAELARARERRGWPKRPFHKPLDFEVSDAGLTSHGLTPEVDARFETGITGAQRLIEMRANRSLAAAMLGPPSSILAKREGFVSLGSSASLIGPLQGTGAYVRREWAREHADLLERYIAATIEAQRWLMSPANRRATIALIAEDAKVPLDVAAETYELAMAPGGWDRDMQFDVDAFNNVLRLRADVENTWDGPPPAPETYYDLTYYESALARLN